MPRCIVPLAGARAGGAGASAHDPSATAGCSARATSGHVAERRRRAVPQLRARRCGRPARPNHLLLGTDLGLRAATGGRSWTPEGQGQIIGAVFALAFTPDGQSAVCAPPRAAFRFRMASGSGRRSG